MFTGIVEGAFEVRSVEDAGGIRRVSLDLSTLADSDSIKLGDSVAINGCCLTVARLSEGIAAFEAVPETLRLTNLGALGKGSLVNVERAMQAGARIDGHFVQGHVDRVGTVVSIRRDADFRIRIECGRDFAVQCIHKGSVCVDGISLTIAQLEEESLTVAVIPHTREVTNIRDWVRGAQVNLEADMIGKYVRRRLDQVVDRGISGVDDSLLRRAGFLP
ncbi:MAG: riboflavin synthase [Planctomycetes bacterium]|nr:riboflavin synthase [Planctomycetota bacterium]